MAETITEMILPGTYIEVKAEGLIRAGGVGVGNVGLVGPAVFGTDYEVSLLSNVGEARERFGPDPSDLLRGIEIAFNNGARKIYAVKVASASTDEYAKGLRELLNEEAHIISLPGADAAFAITPVRTHCEEAENNQRERIGIVGTALDSTLDQIKDQVVADDRLVFVAPGMLFRSGEDLVPVSGSFTACAICGLLSSLPAHHSPTNKTLFIEGVSKRYTRAELSELVSSQVLAVEERGGTRVVRGVTTDKGAWKQITTRRIVDYAKMGVRQGSRPYIGRLNNDRVRKALQATLDGFLAGMKQDEMLTEYTLAVTATRDDEIQGRCIVDLTLKPTFSIDYIRVTIYLG